MRPDQGDAELRQVQVPAGMLIVSPSAAAVIQADISVFEQDAAVRVGLEPVQAAFALWHIKNPLKKITRNKMDIKGFIANLDSYSGPRSYFLFEALVLELIQKYLRNFMKNLEIQSHL